MSPLSRLKYPYLFFLFLGEIMFTNQLTSWLVTQTNVKSTFQKYV